MVGVTGMSKEKYTVENSARNHTWLVDEPVELGGADLAAKPDEILLSALTSCKIITVKMYAERKGWDVRKVSVKLVLGDKVGEKTEILKTIQIEGDLDETQMERLIQVSERCPVAKLLANSFEFRLIH